MVASTLASALLEVEGRSSGDGEGTSQALRAAFVAQCGPGNGARGALRLGVGTAAQLGVLPCRKAHASLQ
jgi:hypothetical protein